MSRVGGGRWVPLYDPERDPIREVVLRRRREYRALETATWVLALGLDAGDFVTTYVGVAHPSITEGVPLSRWVIATYGWPGLLVEHLLAGVLLLVLWLALSRPYRLVVPGVAAWAGFVVIGGNLQRLLEHGVLVVPW